MKEEFISFETAKLAKEKGFKEVIFESDGTGNLTRIYNVPTQSLLQKWLRENHKKFVKTHPVYRDEKVQWEYVIFFLDDPLLSGTDGFKNRMSLLDYPYYWETEEEALEKGLQKALKLIQSK